MRMINRIFKDKNLLYLLIIGLVVRFLFFYGLYPEATVYPDSQGYLNLAKKLSTFSLEGYSGKRSPGYPLLLLFALGKLKVVVVYQFIIGTIGALFWYKTLINLKFRPKESFYIVLILQSSLNVFFYETAILVESLSLFFVSFIMYCITRPDYANNQTYWKEILLSLAMGYLVLIKPFFAYMPFLVYGAFTLQNFNLKRIINKKLILLIFPLLAYFGWSYINKLNTGYFVSTTYLGLNMAQNCVYFAEKAPEEYQWIAQPYAKYRDKTIEENRDVAMSIWNAYGEGKAFEKYGLSFPELSHEFGEYAKATIVANPKDYLKQVVLRSGLDFWKPSVLWRPYNFKSEGIYSIILKLWHVQIVFWYLITVVFFLISLVVFTRALYNRYLDISFLLISFVFVPSVLQALVTYGTNSRYSFPFDFIMPIVVLLFLKKMKIWNTLKTRLKKKK